MDKDFASRGAACKRAVLAIEFTDGSLARHDRVFETHLEGGKHRHGCESKMREERGMEDASSLGRGRSLAPNPGASYVYDGRSRAGLAWLSIKTGA